MYRGRLHGSLNGAGNIARARENRCEGPIMDAPRELRAIAEWTLAGHTYGPQKGLTASVSDYCGKQALEIRPQHE